MKLDISVRAGKEKGKTFHLEVESKVLIGKELGQIVKGKDLLSELEGYEFKITGGSDKAGFPMLPQFPGTSLRKVTLAYGRGMREKRPKGLRKAKSVRGRVIGEDIVQVNLVVEKQGEKPLDEILKKEKKGEEGKSKEEREK